MQVRGDRSRPWSTDELQLPSSRERREGTDKAEVPAHTPTVRILDNRKEKVGACHSERCETGAEGCADGIGGRSQDAAREREAGLRGADFPPLVEEAIDGDNAAVGAESGGEESRSRKQRPTPLPF